MIKAGLADKNINIKLELYTNDELRNMIQHIKAVIIPLGSIEQHSTHLPIGTDYLISYKLALEVARKLLEEKRELVIVSPPIPYGISYEWTGRGNCTLSLSTHTYISLIKEIIESYINLGFKNIILLNAHGGNKCALELVAREIASKTNVKILVINWWELVSTEIEKHAIQKKMLHAGEVETSLALVLDIPVKQLENSRYVDVKDMPWMKNGYIIYSRESMNIIESAIGIPIYASKEKGLRILESLIHKVINILEQL